MQLEEFDLGKPTSPKIIIIKEGEIMEHNYKPFAIQNKNGHWLYNFKAAKLEAKFIGKKIPTDRQWSKLVKTKDDIPNVVFAGYCIGGYCYSLGFNAKYWSSTVFLPDPTYSWYRYLSYAYRSVDRVANAQSVAFSVRCLKTKK